MTPRPRGDAPPLLSKYEKEIGARYAARRAEKSNHVFQWPTREGRNLREVAREALVEMTAGHCSYCDAFPLAHVGADEIDHFRPKTWPEFYSLVCCWENLFLICRGCNLAKGNEWDESLLRPDDSDFVFSRYFLYRTDTGELLPNPGASPVDQHRAKTTIQILRLNRGEACKARQRTARRMQSATEEDLMDLAYHFLWPFCREF